MPDCAVNCSENPDAVNKTNWKCDACGHDLKKDFERVIKERSEESRKSPLLEQKRVLEEHIKNIENQILIEDKASGQENIS